MNSFTHVAARPDGNLLAASTTEGWLGVWRREDDALVATHSLGSFINKIGWTADGAHLLATAGDELLVFSTDGSARVTAIATGHNQLRTFAVHPSQPLVATTGNDGMTRLWTLPSGQKTGEVLQKRGAVSGGGTAVALAEDIIVVGYANGTYGTCDPDGSNTGGGEVFGGEVASLAVLPIATLKAPKSSNFLAGGGRGRLAQLLITPEKMMIAGTWSDPPKPIAANTINVAPDGRFVVACSDDTACLFESNQDLAPSRLGHAFWSDKKSWDQRYIVSAACFVPNTNLIATSHFSGCIKLWRADKTWESPTELRLEGGRMTSTSP